MFKIGDKVVQNENSAYVPDLPESEVLTVVKFSETGQLIFCTGPSVTSSGGYGFYESELEAAPEEQDEPDQTDEIEFLNEQIDGLREAVEFARDIFTFYAEEHVEKSGLCLKAASNLAFSHVMANALETD